MKTILMGAACMVLEVLVTFLLPLALLAVGLLARFAVVAVLPAVILLGLAVASGIARTAGLGVFGVGVVLRLVMAAVEGLGARVPAPRLRAGVCR